MRDRASLFDEGSAREWRGQGVRDRAFLFIEGSAGVWRGLGVRDRASLFDEGLAREWRGWGVRDRASLRLGPPYRRLLRSAGATEGLFVTRELIRNTHPDLFDEGSAGE